MLKPPQPRRGCKNARACVLVTVNGNPVHGPVPGSRNGDFVNEIRIQFVPWSTKRLFILFAFDAPSTSASFRGNLHFSPRAPSYITSDFRNFRTTLRFERPRVLSFLSPDPARSVNYIRERNECNLCRFSARDRL